MPPDPNTPVHFRSLRRPRRKLAALSAALLVAGLFVVVAASPAEAIAPGCSAARPTSISGSSYGYPDNRALNVFIGIDLLDATGHRVNVDGSPSTSAAYPITKWINTRLPATGAVHGVRSYAAVCVSSRVRLAWVEAYPKNPSGHTDKARYGEGNAQNIALKVGGINTNVGTRLPLLHAFGGNTGYVNGYLSYGGRPIPAGDLNINTWTLQTAATCGVHSFNAGTDNLGASSNGKATYFKVDGLAAGQCGQASQPYRIFITCRSVCGGGSRTVTRIYNIANGKGSGVVVNF